MPATPPLASLHPSDVSAEPAAGPVLDKAFELYAEQNQLAEDSIDEMYRFEAVSQQVHRLVQGKSPDAGATLVRLLHEGEDKFRVFEAMTTGMTVVMKEVGTNMNYSFVTACAANKRPDILKAVYEAGAPQWLKDIPRVDVGAALTNRLLRIRLQHQFELLGFRLPVLKKPSDWLRALESVQGTYDSPVKHRSLYLTACDYSDDRVHALLEIAHAAAPVHADLDLIEKERPDLFSFITGLRMRDVIGATEPAGPPAARPRIRTGL